MPNLLQLDVILHSRLLGLTTLLPDGTPVSVIPDVPARGQVATVWMSGGLAPPGYFWPFHVGSGTNDDASDRVRGFGPCQTEPFMDMMWVA